MEVLFCFYHLTYPKSPLKLIYHKNNILCYNNKKDNQNKKGSPMNIAEKQTIAKIAEQIRDIVMQGDVSNIRLPQRLNEVGISVEYTEDLSDEIDAYIIWDKTQNRPKIVFNLSTFHKRTLFSLAHELGHLVLHWKWIPTFKNEEISVDGNSNVLSVYYRKETGYTEEEREKEYQANYFAANFLIPEEIGKNFIRQQMGSGVHAEDIISNMETTFYVSHSMAATRFSNLLMSLSEVGNV